MTGFAFDTDCVVVGAGPAGMSAATWLSSLDLDYRWVAPDGQLGGQLHRVHNDIRDYPGGVYDDGADLVDQLSVGLAGVDATVQAGRVASMTNVSSGWSVRLSPPRSASLRALTAPTIILATGTRYRCLGVPGEAESMGECVSQSATADGPEYAGEPVAVVGGGDAGFENALRLAALDCRVSMLLRNATFKARRSFVARVCDHPNIEFHPFPTHVERVEQTHPGCRLHLDVAGDPQTLEVACLFVRIGVEPVIPSIEPAPSTTDDGFVVVDPRQDTSADGMFAAGDVTDATPRAVATAVGAGARAAQSVADYLTASD